ncbi:ribonuclease R [Allofranklinella schreckenbergeri]|uniref:Ribonuclease R n=1 Tax=Allofranklinella schreckenbergeri TaxID=1076744 RepID=A0A3M6PVF9_9BURK|nr:ribonuclease R [Allofranklinella schreckenbergeri]RMW95082.1 ribonuclease R [Allofranklinella schreckenbergeri]
MVIPKNGSELKKSYLTQEIVGTVQGRREGHGFITPDDGSDDVYLPPEEMRQLVHRDRVLARIVRLDRKGRPEGRVLEILERPTRTIVGRLLREHGVWLVAPEDRRYGQDVLIPDAALAQAQEGQVVVAELTQPPSLHVQPVGRIAEVLGDADDAGMEIEIAVRKYEVPHVFSDACQKAAAKLPATVRAADRRGRIDLRDVPLVTIDGEDARDFDDAVYCEPAKVGRGKGWRLLVAIADVSHYVPSGGAIDADAFERATSIYFPRRVIPMLPEKLSNGLCSLNPGVDRLCMVCDMLVTAKGEIQAYQFYPAVMHSHARMTYTQVADILANPRSPVAQQYQALAPEFAHLHGVYQALLAARQARGAVDFEATETQILSDEESGRITQIVPRERTEAHRLIEEAMLAANVCTADFLQSHRHRALYRVHEGPTPERQNVLRAYLQALGLGLSIGDDPQPADFQRIAEATKDRPDAKQIHAMLLRSMQQAIYTPHNSGHFGLAYEAYTHFTSPIRRYPDLLVHRVLKAMLEGGQYHLPAIPEAGAATEAFRKKLAAKVAPPPEVEPSEAGAGKQRRKSKSAQRDQRELQSWEAAGLHCSANERRADEASRDVEAWLKCQYMREHLGQVFAGTVTAATNFGIFVTLDAMFVEGLVHVTELGSEYFRWDETRQELRGERTGVRYAVGTRLQVQVSRVDLDARKIDFTPVDDERPWEGARASRSTGRTSGRPSAQGEAASQAASGKAARAKDARVKKGSKAGSKVSRAKVGKRKK